MAKQTLLRLQRFRSTAITASIFLAINFSSAQNLSIQETAKETPVNSREQSFKQIVKQEEGVLLKKMNDSLAVVYPDTAARPKHNPAPKVNIIQKDIHLTLNQPSGYTDEMTYQVQLNIGLTQNGDECFSETFILNKDTPVDTGAAFYLKNQVMNFEITSKKIANKPLYCTVTVTASNGQSTTYNVLFQ